MNESIKHVKRRILITSNGQSHLFLPIKYDFVTDTVNKATIIKPPFGENYRIFTIGDAVVKELEFVALI